MSPTPYFRSQSFALMKPGSRLIVCGNASVEWEHQVKTNDLWRSGTTVSGFNAGSYFRIHPLGVRAALEAGLRVVASGLGETEIEVLPLEEAALAHERMENRALNGRIVLTP